MKRAFCTMVAASATYGFSIGAVHSWLYATRNLVKFPLLLLCTGVVCALAYFVLARFLGTPLTFRLVQRAVLEIFRDLAVLLASFAPVTLFLALTLQKPVGTDLGEYPFFQGLNVIAIALCGCLAVARQAAALRNGLRLQGRLIVTLLAGWMALSLFAGGQCAWYLRPFFGIASRIDNNPPFCMGTAPDFRGARNFYEAVYNLIDPPRQH